MAININTLKNWFKTGLKPTQEQFWQWMDSYWHKEDSIGMNNINGLSDTLSKKADSRQLTYLAQKDASNLSSENVINWKSALGVGDLPTNVATVDEGDKTGNVYTKTQSDVNYYQQITEPEDGTYLLRIDGTAVNANDFGKVDKVMNIVPDANKNVDISGVAMNWTNPQQRFSGLQDKSIDATFSSLMEVDPAGNVGKGNGKVAFKNLPSLLSDEEKSNWKTEMNGGWTANTMSVGSISPLIMSSLYDGISYMVLYGANLNFNPNNFSVAIVDLTGNVIKEIPNSQVQLNTVGTSLTFYNNYKSIPEGDYKLRLRTGVAQYTTPMKFTLLSSNIEHVNLNTLIWEQVGYEGKLNPNNVLSGGSVSYIKANGLPVGNSSSVVWGAKSSNIFEETDNFYLSFSLNKSLQVNDSEGSFFHFGLMSTDSNLALSSSNSIEIKINTRHVGGSVINTQTYLNSKLVSDVKIGAGGNIQNYSTEVFIIKQDNMITIINNGYQYSTTLNFVGGMSFGIFGELLQHNNTASVNIQEAYKF